MTEDFVSFDLAKKLKEKGFPQYTEKSYFVGDHKKRMCSVGTFLHIHTQNTAHLIAAPTIAQVLKWLEKEKKIFIAINIGYCYESYEKPFPTNPKMEPILKGYYYGIWELGNLNDKYARSQYFKEPEQAAIAGIEYVIDNLI